MLGIEFVILLIMFMLNLVCLIIKDKNMVYFGLIVSLFTFIICVYYIVYITDLVFGVEPLFVTFVGLTGALTLWIKGSEKW